MIDDKQDFSLAYWSLRKDKLKSERKCPLFSSIEDMFTLHRKLSAIVRTATTRGCTSRSHISNNVPARLAERVWCTKFQSSLLNIYFRLSCFQSSLLLIYFRDVPNRCSHCDKVGHKTCPMCDTPLLRSARRSFAPS